VRVALDTNILAYAQGVNGEIMKKAALGLMRGLPPDAVVVSAQALAELFQVLIRKGKLTPSEARAAIISWCNYFPVVDTTQSVLSGAAELAVTHRFSFWDGLVVASAAEAGCRLLLSEDLQNGFIWNTVTIVNPFATPRYPLLERLLNGQV
jgi:predicted nucleic acid-binding protein